MLQAKHQKFPSAAKVLGFSESQIITVHNPAIPQFPDSTATLAGCIHHGAQLPKMLRMTKLLL